MVVHSLTIYAGVTKGYDFSQIFKPRVSNDELLPQTRKNAFCFAKP